MNFCEQFQPPRKRHFRANFGSATVGKCELEGGALS